jgi:hemerythrin-like domain-containing protein
MKPRGLLMIEHRLIEKMIEVIRKEMAKIKETNKVDTIFIDTAVDFIRIYADKTHHGKEEDILFRDCAKKDMSEKDIKIMNELVEEHKYGRRIVAELVEAKDDYIMGNDTIDIILKNLGRLVEFYPEHIKKEDRVFFPDSEKYFSTDELEEQLREFREFDQTMIHEKYRMDVEQLRSRDS